MQIAVLIITGLVRLSSQAFQGLPTDIVQLESIKVFPDPPKPGQELTVKATGIVTEVIEVCGY